MTGQQQGDDKSSMQILWIIFGIFFVGAVIWWQFGDALKQFFLWVRWIEIKLIAFVIEFFPLAWITPEFSRSAAMIDYINRDSLNVDIAMEMSEGVGNYLRYPLGVILGILSYIIYTGHIKQRYKKTYDMNALRTQEKSNWPQIEPIDRLDLVNEDLDEGPWAMAMTPMIFAKKHKLLKVEFIPSPPGILEKKKNFKATIIRERADIIFSKQLNRLWTSPDRMPPYAKALFAVFIARGCRDSKTAMTLMGQFARSMGENGKLDMNGVDDLIKKHFNNPEVQEICQMHAYENTIMVSCLGFARQDGVLASADFIWLKPVDRLLWYVLNSVGRQTPHVEGAGVYAHWLAERALKRPLTVPMIREATRAFEIAIGEIIYKPTREEEKEILERFQTENR